MSTSHAVIPRLGFRQTTILFGVRGGYHWFPDSRLLDARSFLFLALDLLDGNILPVDFALFIAELNLPPRFHNLWLNLGGSLRTCESFFSLPGQMILTRFFPLFGFVLQ
jgi:hypothetical protein